MTGVISVVPARAQPGRRTRGTAAMATVGAILLVGGAALVVQAADPFRGASDLSASAAPLPSPTTLVAKTNVRSLARVLPDVVAAPAPARPVSVNLVSLASPPAPPAAPTVAVEAHDPHDAPHAALPPPVRPLTLAIPRAVRIKSPTSFALGEVVYRLSDIDDLGVNACPTRRSGHCYRHPRGDLKTAIAGATLRCRPLGAKGGETLVDCVKDGYAKDDETPERDAKL